MLCHIMSYYQTDHRREAVAASFESHLLIQGLFTRRRRDTCAPVPHPTVKHLD